MHRIYHSKKHKKRWQHVVNLITEAQDEKMKAETAQEVSQNDTYHLKMKPKNQRGFKS